MIVGLGHGTTAAKAIQRIAALLRSGELADLRCVPCSRKVEALANELAIPLTTLEAHPVLDLTIDGADEVAPDLTLIKGHGGALLREKIVAQASSREIIIVDDTKLSPALGTRAAVPVEVIPFGWRTQASYLAELGAQWILRMAGDQPFFSDEGNYILDCRFARIASPAGLALQLQARTGIVAHGLFLGLAHEVIAAGPRGVRELRRAEPSSERYPFRDTAI